MNELIDSLFVFQKQAEALDDGNVEGWLAQFEEALADITNIQEFRKNAGQQE